MQIQQTLPAPYRSLASLVALAGAGIVLIGLALPALKLQFFLSESNVSGFDLMMESLKSIPQLFGGSSSPSTSSVLYTLACAILPVAGVLGLLASGMDILKLLEKRPVWLWGAALLFTILNLLSGGYLLFSTQRLESFQIGFWTFAVGNVVLLGAALTRLNG